MVTADCRSCAVSGTECTGTDWASAQKPLSNFLTESRHPLQQVAQQAAEFVKRLRDTFKPDYERARCEQRLKKVKGGDCCLRGEREMWVAHLARDGSQNLPRREQQLLLDKPNDARAIIRPKKVKTQTPSRNVGYVQTATLLFETVEWLPYLQEMMRQKPV
uniref:Transposase n=1 Tax=Steinernema glaseri TaxID=37863 RepID=A0A1I7ZIU0_9BILA